VIFAAILLGYFGWGGRIRTFTILINSEVSYRLDHAPAGLSTAQAEPKQVSFAAMSAAEDSSKNSTRVSITKSELELGRS
jgi:hypothetical protein